jgi:hypothetical protein
MSFRQIRCTRAKNNLNYNESYCYFYFVILTSLITSSVLDADYEENQRNSVQWHPEVAKNCLRRLQFSDSCRHDYFLFAQDRWEYRRNVNHIVLQIAFG